MNRALRTVALVAGLLSAGGPAWAGPPLLCHPFDIGAAQSLPWDGKDAWWHGRADYDVKSVVADTEALMTASTPVIVRMETLRRAAIYASQDPRVAEQLVTAFSRRAQADGLDRTAQAMALFDAGYLAETLKQIGQLGQMEAFRGRARTVAGLPGLEGYALIKRSLTLAPDDPALQFAAALVTASTDRRAYLQHADKARKGMARDALLARNINHIS